jgi:DNA repair protein RadC
MQTDIKTLLSTVAEVQLSYRTQVPPSQRPQIRKADDAYRILLSVWDGDTLELSETFIVLLLNRANRVMGYLVLSQGGITGTVADIRLIFVAALKAAACNILLAHNHPSGNLEPSEADKTLTAKIVEAGRLLDIQVIDHLIVSPTDYFSFADRGLM